MFYAVTVKLNFSRPQSLRKEIDAAMKEQRNLAYRKFKTIDGAKKAMQKLPKHVQSEVYIEFYSYL